MGIRHVLRRLLGRRERTPLEKAREASKALRREGYAKRRRRPPGPDESAETGNYYTEGGGGSGGGD